MKNRSMTQPGKYRGFTLLEILVSLAIFAVLSVTCYKQVLVSSNALERAELKYKALWIGENAIEEMFLVRDWQSYNNSVREYEIDDEKWIVDIEVKDSDITNIKQIEAKVYKNSTDDTSIISLMRYAGKN